MSGFCVDCGVPVGVHSACCRSCARRNRGVKPEQPPEPHLAEIRLRNLSPVLREAVERKMSRYEGGRRNAVLLETIADVEHLMVCECRDCRGKTLEERLGQDEASAP